MGQGYIVARYIDYFCAGIKQTDSHPLHLLGQGSKKTIVESFTITHTVALAVKRQQRSNHHIDIIALFPNRINGLGNIVMGLLVLVCGLNWAFFRVPSAKLLTGTRTLMLFSQQYWMMGVVFISPLEWMGRKQCMHLGL